MTSGMTTLKQIWMSKWVNIADIIPVELNAYQAALPQSPALHTRLQALSILSQVPHCIREGFFYA